MADCFGPFIAERSNIGAGIEVTNTIKIPHWLGLGQDSAGVGYKDINSKSEHQLHVHGSEHNMLGWLVVVFLLSIAQEGPYVLGTVGSSGPDQALVISRFLGEELQMTDQRRQR